MRKKISYPCILFFPLAAAPWINVVLAVKPRAGVVNFETCLTCLLDALSVPQHGRKHSDLFSFCRRGSVLMLCLSAVPNTKVLHFCSWPP